MIFNKFHHLIYYCLPVIISIIFIYFWCSWTPESAIPGVSLVFNAFIAPIYLAVCNIRIKRISLNTKACYSLLSISIYVMLTYLGWAIGTGNLSSADSMTVLILWGEFIIACIIASFGLIYSFLGPYKYKLKEPNSSSEVEAKRKMRRLR